VTSTARVSADGGDSGSAVPLPLDWPDTGGGDGWFAAEPRVLREVAGRLRGLTRDGGGVRPLGGETGSWSSGRSMQHLHAQLREGVDAFHGALVAGLPAVAAKLELTAANYDSADRASSERVAQAAGGLAAPSVVGPDGRF
jgi:hypothetical protein